MANIDQDSIEKKLVSRRTLISNGITLGIFLTNPFNIPYTWNQKLRIEKGNKNKPGAPGHSSLKDTYIDNFDC